MKNKILSVFCAIAMLATVMSAFVMTASSADAPAITLTVLKEATATEPAEVQIGYEGLAEGSKVAGVQVVIPLDTTKFTFVEGTSAINGETTFGSRTSTIKSTFLAQSASAYITATEGVIGTVKLALAEGVAAGSTYELATDDTATFFTLSTDSGSSDVMMSGKVSLSTGEVQKPAVPEEPTLPEAPYVYAKIVAQPEKAGDEVEFELRYANLAEGSKIAGVQIVLPIDTEKMTFVEGTSAINGETTFGSRTSTIKSTFLAQSSSAYISATEGLIGTFKVKLADTLAIGDSITLAFDSTATFVTLSTDAGSSDVMMEGVASTIVVGSGGEVADPTPTPPTDPTPTPPAEDDKPEEPEKVPAFETEVETETKTVAGAKVNVFTATVAPAEGATAEAVSALIVDDSAYQVIFDGKTSKGYAAGWAMATVSGTKLKDALINGGALVDVQIAIGGADEVVVSVLDSEGNTIVLPEA